MAKPVVVYDIDDAKSVDTNLEVFRDKLTALPPTLGPILGTMLTALEDPASDKPAMLSKLRAALDPPPPSGTAQEPNT